MIFIAGIGMLYLILLFTGWRGVAFVLLISGCAAVCTHLV